MATKLVHSFEHLVKGTSVSLQSQWLGIDANATGGSALAIVYAFSPLRNWLCYTGGTNKMMVLPLNGIGLDYSKKVIIGYRVIGGVVSSIIASMGPGVTYPGGGYFGKSSTDLGIGVSVSAIIEIVLDFVALTTKIYVNGILKFTRANTQAEQDTYKTTHNNLIFADTNATAGNGSYVTDILVRDSSDGEDIKPLGIWAVTPLVAKAATATGWTLPASTTALQVVNTLPVSPFNSPVITNAGTGVIPPVGIDFSVTGGIGIPRAVRLFASVGDSVTPAKTMGIVVKDDVGQLPSTPIPLPAAINTNKVVGVYNQPPGGGSWSWGKVNSLSVAATFA